MPLAQRLLLYVPAVPLGFILIMISVTLAIIGLVIVRRLVPHHILKAHNEMAGPIFEGIAMVYAVLLAFVVVVSWQNFDKTILHVEMEANCLVDIYRGADAFPNPFKDDIKALIKNYSDTVINEEWKMLARGEESVNARMILRNIWASYAGYEPATEREKLFFAESLHKLGELRELRRFRIVDSRMGIEPMLWFVLIAGGMTTISFTFFFGSDNLYAHVVMASALAVIVSLILFMILSFDFPFTGSVTIPPETFQQILNF